MRVDASRRKLTVVWRRGEFLRRLLEEFTGAKARTAAAEESRK